MATLADSQRFLKQKRASGRLSPNEIESAYKAWYSTEAGNLNERARIDDTARRTGLQAGRDAESKRQAGVRDKQAGARDAEAKRQAGVREGLLLRAEKAANETAQAQGRLQLAKMAVPDLFMDGAGGGDEGAQGATESTFGPQPNASGESNQAVSSLDNSEGAPSHAPGVLASDVSLFGDMDWSGGLKGKDVENTAYNVSRTGVALGKWGEAAKMGIEGLAINYASSIIGQLFNGLFSYNARSKYQMDQDFMGFNAGVGSSADSGMDQDFMGFNAGVGSSADSGMDQDFMGFNAGVGGDGFGYGSASDTDAAAGGQGAVNDGGFSDYSGMS